MPNPLHKGPLTEGMRWAPPNPIQNPNTCMGKTTQEGKGYFSGYIFKTLTYPQVFDVRASPTRTAKSQNTPSPLEETLLDFSMYGFYISLPYKVGSPLGPLVFLTSYKDRGLKE